MAYFLVKSLHLLFVMAWVAAVFYLPRILVNLAEARGEPAVEARLALMGRRLYAFGHVTFGLSLAMGLVLWMGYRIHGGWLHAKLVLVALLLGYFIWSMRILRRAVAGGALPTPARLRWFNELPILLALGAIWLVLAKPF